MTKEKIENIPEPGRKLSDEEADKIIQKFNIEYSEEDKKAGKDLEYFVIMTKGRDAEPKEERKNIFHYIPKWDRVYDQELGWIPVEELIEAIQKYYSEIDHEEKYPNRNTVKKLREEKHE